MTTQIIEGDCLDVLRTLPDESIQCCVTSPPYFGLRDYGTAKWEGGDESCDHSPEVRGGRFRTDVSAKQKSNTGSGTASQRDCPCGATRIDAQLGLEKTPELYVEKMVAVFREVRRVLRDDGTLWLNIGDSYAGSWGNYGGQNRGNGKQRAITKGSQAPQEAYDGLESWRPPTSNAMPGIKPKDLIGIPWMLAFALRADGWYLRSDIIWHKPNPMPESVTDRPTKAHEYLFLLTKSARYYYDAQAVAEQAVWAAPTEQAVPSARKYEEGSGRDDGGKKYNGLGFARSGKTISAESRNRRSVWTIPTSPFPGAHFAVMPPKLVEPCILAGTSPQACEKCGSPWMRQVERTAMVIDRSERTHEKGRTRSSGTMVEAPTSRTTGWSPTCSCDNTGSAKCVVLDPFAGAGTVGLVANRLDRSFVGIELNPKYAEMARQRIHNDAPLFTP